MPPRQHLPRLPRIWLMTDERLGRALARAVARLPRGSGVIFRHYATPAAERRRCWRRLRAIAAGRGLVWVRAGIERLPGEDGRHNSGGGGLVTGSAHDRGEARRRVREGARMLVVSPVHGTRTHPEVRAKGPISAARVVRGWPIARIALGGMDARRYAALARLGFDGWAGIDAFTRRAGQKRKAVPR